MFTKDHIAFEEKEEKKEAYFLYCYRVHDAYNQRSSILWKRDHSFVRNDDNDGDNDDDGHYKNM